MVELLFSLAGLHGGKLPFNMLAYAWVLATHCAAAPSHETDARAGKFAEVHTKSQTRMVTVLFGLYTTFFEMTICLCKK